MKTRYALIAGISLLALALPTTALAGKKNKKKDEGPPSAATVLAKYDKNSNGKLEDTEKEAIRAALEKDPDLKPYDKNSDGKLDDAELDALVKAAADTPPAPTKKKKKKKDAA